MAEGAGLGEMAGPRLPLLPLLPSTLDPLDSSTMTGSNVLRPFRCALRGEREWARGTKGRAPVARVESRAKRVSGFDGLAGTRPEGRTTGTTSPLRVWRIRAPKTASWQQHSPSLEAGEPRKRGGGAQRAAPAATWSSCLPASAQLGCTPCRWTCPALARGRSVP